MRNLARNVLTIGAALAPLSTLAHPGAHRNETAWLLAHALTNADHFFVMGAGAALAAWIAMAVLLMRKPEKAAAFSDAR